MPSASDTSSQPAFATPAIPTSTPPVPYVFDGHGANVDAKRFGPTWPLTIRTGRVNCIDATDGLVAEFTTDANVRYWLNDTGRELRSAFGLRDPAKVTRAGKSLTVLADVCAPLGGG